MVPSRACRQWLLKSVRKTRREALSSPGWPCRPCPGQRGSSEKRGDQRPLTRGARAPGKQAARRLAGQAAWREQSWCQQSFMGAGKQGLGSFTPNSCQHRGCYETSHPAPSRQKPPGRWFLLGNTGSPATTLRRVTAERPSEQWARFSVSWNTGRGTARMWRQVS